MRRRNVVFRRGDDLDVRNVQVEHLRNNFQSAVDFEAAANWLLLLCTFKTNAMFHEYRAVY